jgi:hypothetical protein
MLLKNIRGLLSHSVPDIGGCVHFEILLGEAAMKLRSYLPCHSRAAVKKLRNKSREGNLDIEKGNEGFHNSYNVLLNPANAAYPSIL